jgi:hypothetical protein
MNLLHFILTPLIAIRNKDLEHSFAFPLIISTFLGAVAQALQDWKHRHAEKIFTIKILGVLCATTAAFMMGLRVPGNGNVALSIGATCVAIWFVLIPVWIARLGGYYPEPTKVTLTAVLWWTKYILSFFSTFFTLLIWNSLSKPIVYGVVTWKLATVGWMLTYFAFTFQSHFVPQWLKRKLTGRERLQRM